MCSAKIVHSGREYRGPTWGKRLYCDSYLTHRLARCAGATASFNFTKLRGQPKSVRGLLCEDRDVSKRRHARDVDGKGNGAVVWPYAILKKHRSRYSSLWRGGASFPTAAATSSFLWNTFCASPPNPGWRPKNGPLFQQRGASGGGSVTHRHSNLTVTARAHRHPPVFHEWQFE